MLIASERQLSNAEPFLRRTPGYYIARIPPRFPFAGYGAGGVERRERRPLRRCPLPRPTDTRCSAEPRDKQPLLHHRARFPREITLYRKGAGTRSSPEREAVPAKPQSRPESILTHSRSCQHRRSTRRPATLPPPSRSVRP